MVSLHGLHKMVALWHAHDWSSLKSILAFILGQFRIDSSHTCFYIKERHDALYIVGSLEETLEIRGMRYHPIDIENSVLRCSNKIIEW